MARYWHFHILSLAALGCLLHGAGADEPKEAAQLWQQWMKQTPGTEEAGGFLAARFESDDPSGELRLIPYERPVNTQRNGGFRYIVSVAFTPKVRQQFARIGIADLEAHLRGKNVRVRAKVLSCWVADGRFPQMRLVVEDIGQFDGVDDPYAAPGPGT
jgi:hypothetical protein